MKRLLAFLLAVIAASCATPNASRLTAPHAIRRGLSAAPIGGGLITAPIAVLRGPDLSVNSGTITPVNAFHRLTGTANLSSITPPSSFALSNGGGFFLALPTSVFTWVTGGNIATGGTSIVNAPILFVWSQTDSLWYPITSLAQALASGSLTLAGNGALFSNGNLILQASPGAAGTISMIFDTAVNTRITLNIGSPTPQYAWDASSFFQFEPGPAPVAVGKNIAPFADTFVRRYSGKGTPLVAGSFVLGAGWGSTASVSAIAGDDGEYQVTITSSGSGIAANPTTKLLFMDGDFEAAPMAQVQMVNASNSADFGSAIAPVTTTQASETWTWRSTPTSGRTYTFTSVLRPYDTTVNSSAPNAAPVAINSPLPRNNLKVMPIGDSITLGATTAAGPSAFYNQPMGAYRTPLYLRFQEWAVPFTFVGSQPQSGPVELGDKHHNAVSGITVEGVQANIANYLANDPNPDVIVIHLGTNNGDVNQSLTDLAALLDTIIASPNFTAANCKIILCQITPRGDSTEATFVVPYNAGMPAICGARPKCILANVHDALNATTDIADLIHPNAWGSYKMSVVIWNALTTAKLDLHRPQRAPEPWFAQEERMAA